MPGNKENRDSRDRPAQDRQLDRIEKAIANLDLKVTRMGRTLDEGVASIASLKASATKQNDLLNKVYAEVVALRAGGGFTQAQQDQIDAIVNGMDEARASIDTTTAADDDDPST